MDLGMCEKTVLMPQDSSLAATIIKGGPCPKGPQDETTSLKSGMSPKHLLF